MRAFLSYQTSDKVVAGEVRTKLDAWGVDTFLAHEDIEVSFEWQRHILDEINRCDLFIAILSANYVRSPYCMQESGIAVFKPDTTIIPLSIDGQVPPGFLAHIQSRKIEPGSVDERTLLPGLARRDVAFVIDLLIGTVGRSGSYRGAEANFELILPYLDRATDEQVARLLKVSSENGQVWDASLCKTKYLPPLLNSHGRLLDKVTRRHLEKVLSPNVG